jgi:hypothetical protein
VPVVLRVLENLQSVEPRLTDLRLSHISYHNFFDFKTLFKCSFYKNHTRIVRNHVAV